jgi:hypothetical protein
MGTSYVDLRVTVEAATAADMGERIVTGKRPRGTKVGSGLENNRILIITPK